MSMSTIYLISGANRGIGYALVSHILTSQNNAFVYAGVRDPEAASSLKELQKKHTDRIAIVKCISADVEGNAALAKEIGARHQHLDTVIANAGILNDSSFVTEVPPNKLEEHFKVNVSGPIILFQAVYELLKKSSKPRFVPISSSAGCMDGALVKAPLGSVCYGASKAALNWATRKIHFENDWLVAFPLAPGPVGTDMYDQTIANDKTGHMKKWVSATGVPTPDTVAPKLIAIIDKSTRVEHGGEFVNVDGTKIPW